MSIDTQICDADEWLYGRAGYLYGLLTLRQKIGLGGGPDEKVNNKIRSTVVQIIQSGRILAHNLGYLNKGLPLFYLWCDEGYLGAAHGLSGIFYMLLCAKDFLSQPDLDDIRQGITFLGQECICEKSGTRNYPATIEDVFDHRGRNIVKVLSNAPMKRKAELSASGCLGESLGFLPEPDIDFTGPECLVHFCHGAPGLVFLFCKAHEVFDSVHAPQEYDFLFKKLAYQAGEVVWRYGILKKGPGLCHGVAGNAYSMLCLYNTFKDHLWLQRAYAFARSLIEFEGKYSLSQ